jgi:hypothetical protein
MLATEGAAGMPLASVGAEELLLATVGAAGMPLATGGVALSPSIAAVSRDAASPADDQPEEPSDTKLELPLPRKLKLFARGWKSDDTKTFDTDRGREGDGTRPTKLTHLLLQCHFGGATSSTSKRVHRAHRQRRYCVPPTPQAGCCAGGWRARHDQKKAARGPSSDFFSIYWRCLLEWPDSHVEWLLAVRNSHAVGFSCCQQEIR